MAKKKSNPTLLDQLRTGAFLVTVGSAVAYGLLVGFAAISENPGSWAENLSIILIKVTVIGGVCMGLLYALHKVSNKK